MCYADCSPFGLLGFTGIPYGRNGKIHDTSLHRFKSKGVDIFVGLSILLLR